ncbi:MAG: STAS domain-containing protein [Planctomycetota bacterium]
MDTGKKRGMLITRESDGVLVVYFTVNSLVFPNDIESAGRELMKLLEETSSLRVALEMSALKQISSGFVSKLLLFSRQLGMRGGKLVLCGMSPQVDQVFKILRLQKILTTVKDEYEAVNKLLEE